MTAQKPVLRIHINAINPNASLLTVPNLPATKASHRLKKQFPPSKATRIMPHGEARLDNASVRNRCLCFAGMEMH